MILIPTYCINIVVSPKPTWWHYDNSDWGTCWDAGGIYYDQYSVELGDPNNIDCNRFMRITYGYTKEV